MHADTSSWQLKIDCNFFSYLGQKMGGQSDHLTLKLTVSQEQIIFFVILHACAISGKVKVASLIFGWV